MNLARSVAERFLRSACEKLSPFLGQARTIYDRSGVSPYLTRYYILGRRLTDDGKRVSRLPVNIFLHHFHRGDDDAALHSHPWSWSFAIILEGGYLEERRVGDGVIRRCLLPLSLNVIRSEDYHRVDLLAPTSWTLFFAGPKVEDWYFWDRESKLRARWDLYIRWLRGNYSSIDMWESDAREPLSEETKLARKELLDLDIFPICEVSRFVGP